VINDTAIGADAEQHRHAAASPMVLVLLILCDEVGLEVAMEVVATLGCVIATTPDCDSGSASNTEKQQ
jgi:hypothetical protein